jgi:hypothetical protein
MRAVNLFFLSSSLRRLGQMLPPAPRRRRQFQFPMHWVPSSSIIFFLLHFLHFAPKKKKLSSRVFFKEFSQRNQPVSFTFAARLSFNSSKVKLAWLSLKQQPCV